VGGGNPRIATDPSRTVRFHRLSIEPEAGKFAAAAAVSTVNAGKPSGAATAAATAGDDERRALDNNVRGSAAPAPSTAAPVAVTAGPAPIPRWAETRGAAL
jgi:hypothetical protein